MMGRNHRLEYSLSSDRIEYIKVDRGDKRLQGLQLFQGGLVAQSQTARQAQAES